MFVNGYFGVAFAEDEGAAAPLSTGSITVYDTDGSPASGIEVQIQQLSGTGGGGQGFSREVFKITTNGSGIATHDHFRECTYRARIGNGQWVSYTVPDSASFDMPDLIGVP